MTRTVGSGRRMAAAVRSIRWKAIAMDALSGRGTSGTIVLLLLYGLFAFWSLRAAGWVGYILGWLTGASKSPLSNAIVPGLFGLLAIAGLRSRRLNFRTPGDVIAAIFAAILVIHVCDECFYGIRDGVEVREQAAQRAAPPAETKPATIEPAKQGS